MRIKRWKIKLFTVSMVPLLLAVLLVCSSSQAAGNNAVSISTPITGIGPAKIKQVAGNQVLINIDHFPQGGSPGDPLLPYKRLSVLVPPDTDLKKVKAELAGGKWEELPGEYEIAPAPPAAASKEGKSIISLEGKDPSRIVNGRDIDIYGADAYFPAQAVQIESVGMFRQWKIVELRVWLAVYNPVAKKVRVVSNSQITLTAEKLPAGEAVGLNSAVLPKFPKIEKFLPELKAKIDNTQDIERFYGEQAAPGDAAAQGGGPAPLLIPADYVIITTSTIVANSADLTNFIAAKTAAGFTVKTVTEGAAPETDTTYITGGTVNARADNIRTWLFNHYLGDGIQYVLLVGNPSSTGALTNTSVPMKIVWPRGSSGPDTNCPTDMYFAELSGNWDIDANGFYGEFNSDYGVFGGADKNCELKVGRIPVYNANCADLNSILQKSISYDANSSASAWRSKVLLPAAVSNWDPQDDAPYDGINDYSWGDTFGDDWGEDIKTLANSISFSPYTLYEKSGVYADGSAYPLTACNAALLQANVVNEWQNLYGFVTWWGHGNFSGAYRRVWQNDNYNNPPNPPDHWTQHNAETSDIAFFTNANCASLDNNNPSFVVQVSCENGWPENQNNLGFRLLRQGAIGTISGTRVTWYAIGPWNTGWGPSIGDNASYGYYCFDRMSRSGEDIGTALVYCRSNFGTGWTNGSSWMNMVGFNIYGDPSLDMNVPIIGPKWKQPPDTSESGMDIRCDRKDQIPRLLADDFLCTQTGPITKITIWGSWKDDIKGDINSIYLSIHSDKPDPDGNEGPAFSEPNELLWSKTILKANITESLYSTYVEEWWWDSYTMSYAIWPGDHQIWQYDINIPSNPFVQQGDPNHPIVYWLDAYVDLNMIPTGAQFGWKTSSQHWNDDAVRWIPAIPGWMELRYPTGHPYCPNSIDLAFAIHTGELPYEVKGNLKWSQPPIEIYPSEDNITYCGWDEKSYNRDPCTQGPWKIVADDFRCLGTMPVTSIHWWGSYFDWEYDGFPPGSLPSGWHIGFWSNVRAFEPPQLLPYSYPSILLHSFTVPASRVTIKQVAKDYYHGYYPNDTCFEYSLKLDPCEIFWQNDFNQMTQDNIYWLSITADYNNQPTPYYPWGWKSRPWHWMDDAVTFNLPMEPLPDQGINPNFITPIKDPPFFLESFDMSFELDTDPNYIKWEQDFTGIRDWPHYEDVNSTVTPVDVNERLVADDWRCVRRTPVTAIVWWGSFVGYQYQACSSPIMPLPVPPDKFRLKIWTDVPAGADPDYAYSHPGNVIWQFTTQAYDEVLVGFDKHPEIIQPTRTEPVFRYSVRLPEERWFRQPDYNEVFWLSIQAVYDINQPNYTWGWTNHPHVFNDDAVSGDFNEFTGHWDWTELYDQTQTSEDMSFVLFTDPNVCSTCANYNCDNIVNFPDFSDFADNWLASVPPGGYDNSDLNCDGTVDWYDVKLFALQWLTSCP